jgi:hypothetical protein
MQGTPYDFEFHWVPQDLTMDLEPYTGNISSFSIPLGAQAVGGYDAFGIYWTESADEITFAVDGYFDNLILVPVPEPSRLAGGFGLAGCWPHTAGAGVAQKVIGNSFLAASWNRGWQTVR